ncbi:MAG: hypothetical protein J3R72DRAFT_493185 [Linnemannia gamsii]|nr:MAG: hypothetical protein J3R72DRAFT_493185 [Linnemannia gamsii]
MIFNHRGAFSFSNLRPCSTQTPSSSRSSSSRHSIGGCEGLVWSAALKPSQFPPFFPTSSQQQYRQGHSPYSEIRQSPSHSHSPHGQSIDMNQDGPVPPAPAAAQPDRQQQRRRDRRHVRTSMQLVMEQLAVCDSNEVASGEGGAEQHQEPTLYLLHPTGVNGSVSNGQGEYPQQMDGRRSPSRSPRVELEMQTEEPEIPLPTSTNSRITSSW